MAAALLTGWNDIISSGNSIPWLKFCTGTTYAFAGNYEQHTTPHIQRYLPILSTDPKSFITVVSWTKRSPNNLIWQCYPTVNMFLSCLLSPNTSQLLTLLPKHPSMTHAVNDKIQVVNNIRTFECVKTFLTTTLQSSLDAALNLIFI